jgi:hypothetical protein
MDHIETTLPTVPHCRGNVFTDPLPTNDRGIYRQTHTLPFDTTRTTQKTSNSSIVECVFDAAVTILPSRCPATYTYRHRLTGGIHELRYSDWLRCHDMHTKFHKYCFRHSNVNRGDT